MMKLNSMIKNKPEKKQINIIKMMPIQDKEEKDKVIVEVGIITIRMGKKDKSITREAIKNIKNTTKTIHKISNINKKTNNRKEMRKKIKRNKSWQKVINKMSLKFHILNNSFKNTNKILLHKKKPKKVAKIVIDLVI